MKKIDIDINLRQTELSEGDAAIWCAEIFSADIHAYDTNPTKAVDKVMRKWRKANNI